MPAWEGPAKQQDGAFADSKSASSTAISVPSTADSKLTLTSYDMKHNPQLVRMLHQIQSDIKVKEQLVSHLEKSEMEYAFMRRKFDDKVAELQAQLAELQRERDTALMRTKSRFATKSDVALQMKEKQQLIDIRHAYEAKMKTLLSEISELKRKYSQTTMAMQATRNQNETLLRSLRANVETLQIERKRMVKRMKAEQERVREQMSNQERKILQLQRQQAEANMAKRRLEREHENQKLMLKKRNEEILMNHSQLKQMINVLKKAVREGGILDERLLSKVSHIIGGSFAIVARGGLGYPNRRQNRKKTSTIPLDIRAKRKKELLDKALCQYIQGKQAVVEMEQLLVRRERLAAEKLELLEERKHIYLAEKENAEKTGQPMDTMAIELTDERIDLMSAEIAYLSARIRALQSEAAGDSLDEDGGVVTIPPRAEKHVTFADEIISNPNPQDEWADMDAFEEQYSVPANAAPEMAYDITVKLLKSLEPDECKRIAEALVEDITSLRMSECNRQVAQQNLEKTVMDLRRTLIVMKRAAIATTVENERRIRKLEEQKIDPERAKTATPMDARIEEYINSGTTIFDKIYEDGLRGMINSPEPDVMDGRSSSEVSLEEIAEPSALSCSPRMSPQRNGVLGPPKPVKSLVDKVDPNRETTPSPDRFFNMIQKRLSWQQREGGSESPVPITMISPAEFARYAMDRDSSTSSIRSSHLRRSSLQSDYSSSQSQNSWNNTVSTTSQGSLRKRANTLQQHQPTLPPIPPPPPRHRLAALQTNHGLMPNARENAAEYDVGLQPPLPPSSPLANYSVTTRQMKRATMPSTTSTTPTPNNHHQQHNEQRSGTPVNVFDRLSQTPTRASRAKMAFHRHSSGSVDELKRRWDSLSSEYSQTSPASATDRVASPFY